MLKRISRLLLFLLLATPVLLVTVYGGRTTWFDRIAPGLDGRVLLFLLVVLVIFAVVIAVKFIDRWLIKRKFYIPPTLQWILVVAMSLALMFLQFNFIKQYNFYTGWDAGTVFDSSQNILAGKGAQVSWLPEYYNIYDNNRTIVSLFVLSAELVDKLGIRVEDNNDVYIAIQLVVYLIASISLFVLVRIATGRFLYAWLSWLILFILIGVSPWLSIPYTDCMSMAFSIFALLVFVVRANNSVANAIKWFALGFIAILAISLKPQSAIMMVAIVCYLLMVFIDKKMRLSHIEIRNTIVGAVTFGIAVTVTLIGVNAINDRYVPIEKGYSMPWTHFVMMGLNNYNNGSYNDSDVYVESLGGQFGSVNGVYRRDQSNRLTSEQIKDRNILEIKNRLHDYGVIGFLNHLKNKSINNFKDGTFAWFGEGAFDLKMIDRAGKPGNWLRSLYYYPVCNKTYQNACKYYSGVSNYNNFRNVELIVWWIVVLLASIAGLLRWKNDKVVLSAMLAVIGVCLFELIFESRSRYFITMTPVFVLLAVVSIAELAKAKWGGKLGLIKQSFHYAVRSLL